MKIFFISFFSIIFLLITSCAERENKQTIPDSRRSIKKLHKQETVTGILIKTTKKSNSITVETPQGPLTLRYAGNFKDIKPLQAGVAVILTLNKSGENKGKKIVRIQEKRPSLSNAATEILPEELFQLITSTHSTQANSNHLLIDSRPAHLFHQGHIPTAISIPYDTMVEKVQSQLSMTDKKRLLIFYGECPTCYMSSKAALLAQKMGFTNIKVLLKGVQGWKQSDHYIFTTRSVVTKKNPILLDLRPTKETVKGHIPGSINIPLVQLTSFRQKFPNNKFEPIVLYGYGEQAEQALQIFKNWGFLNVTLLEGGFSGWLQAGYKTLKKTKPTKSQWNQAITKGEITVADFQNSIRKKLQKTTILDVRTHDEIKNGIISNAIHVPLNNLHDNLAQLPMNKKILIYSSNGARAELAHLSLQQAGFKSRYLFANVICKDGQCEIEK